MNHWKRITKAEDQWYWIKVSSYLGVILGLRCGYELALIVLKQNFLLNL